MAQIFIEMSSEDKAPAKCREARRRRMEMRRFAAIAGATSPEAESTVRKEKRRYQPDPIEAAKRGRTSPRSPSPLPSGEQEDLPVQASASGPPPLGELAPIFGSMSVIGRSREMEDAISVRPEFFVYEVAERRSLHFFGVFDGHGGSHVATLCKELMHVYLAEELERVSDASRGGSDPVGEMGVEGWKTAMGRCFGRMDKVALSACSCGSVGVTCDCEPIGLTSEIEGSTAVVAVVNSGSIVVANCGDSRAVLSRCGRAIPLSDDHKPDRPDELARIEEAGGRVIYLNGARVLGILAMSRALGDKYLKPIVISDPEVNVIERTADDECLILASDGLWDVLSNEMACDVARRCLHEGSPSSSATAAEILTTGGDESIDVDKEIEASRSRCSLAAALLTRLALGRKSSDNISVIVIDLKRG